LQNRQGLKVLAAGSVLQLFLGIIYVWSVYVKPVSDFYNWDVEKVKLMSSFMLCFFPVGILTGGKLMIRVGAPKVVLMGGLMLSAGMFASAFLTQETVWLMYITYGVVGGFGVGAGYSAVITAAQKWFPQNRGFATGVSLSAFGFSTVIFAPLVETLIDKFGLSSTFLILAAGFFVLVLALFRLIVLPDDSAPTAAAAALLAKRQYTLSEALKTREFYLITVSMMLATSVFFVLNPAFKEFALERGFSNYVGTVIVMLTGVASAVGRIAAPLMSDKIGREKAAIVIILATVVCTLLLCFAQGPLFIASIAVIAFCFGGFSGVYPVLTADCFGIKNVGANYGAVMIGFSVSALTFPLIIGAIGNVTMKFLVLGALAGVGVMLVALLLAGRRKEM
jgi:OFA family oxalate/formate antiporter-like MFS transporter